MDVHAAHRRWAQSEEAQRVAESVLDVRIRLGALQVLERQDPSAPMLQFALSQNHAELGDLDAAASYLRRVLSLGCETTEVCDAVRRLVTRKPELRSLFRRWEKPRRQRLSAAMIVRDEAEFIGDCLENLSEFCDEIIVVDTGSKDATPAIAERYGAKLHYFDWCDDFAAARNESLRYVTGDWVLWIDADERIPNHGGIRRVMQNPNLQGCYLFIQNAGQPATDGWAFPRLWRHHPTTRIEYPVYEQVEWSILPVARRFGRRERKKPCAIIEHYGNTPSMIALRHKVERYLPLFEKRIKTDCLDMYAVYHYAAWLLSAGLYDKALVHFQYWDAMTMSAPRDAYTDSQYEVYLACLRAMGLHEEARRIMDRRALNQ